MQYRFRSLRIERRLLFFIVCIILILQRRIELRFTFSPHVTRHAACHWVNRDNDNVQECNGVEKHVNQFNTHHEIGLSVFSCFEAFVGNSSCDFLLAR